MYQKLEKMDCISLNVVHPWLSLLMGEWVTKWRAYTLIESPARNSPAKTDRTGSGDWHYLVLVTTRRPVIFQKVLREKHSVSFSIDRWAMGGFEGFWFLGFKTVLYCSFWDMTWERNDTKADLEYLMRQKLLPIDFLWSKWFLFHT